MTAGSPSSGTARKLGVKAGTTVAVVAAPSGWTVQELPPGAELVRCPAGTPTLPEGIVAGPDVIVVAFLRSQAVLESDLDDLAGLVWPATALWLAWPRRAGGHESDLTDVIIRDRVLTKGLVDNKVAAIDADWSGLRFVWRKERRDGRPQRRQAADVKPLTSSR